METNEDAQTVKSNSGVGTALWSVFGLALVLGAVGLLLGVALFIVPRYEEIFADFDAQLPVITVFVLSVSRFLRTWWALVVPVSGLVAAGLVVPYVLLPRYRKLLVSIYVVVGWTLFAAAVAVVVFAMFMPLIALMNDLSR